MRIHPLFRAALLASLALTSSAAQAAPRAISPDLFGIFFEDINYAADGRLYAELVQNRSFEYAPSDHDGWNSLTAWDYLHEGYAMGSLSVESADPLNAHNPHYVRLRVESPFQKGPGLRNTGFDGIAVAAGGQYDFSLWARTPGGPALLVQLRDAQGAYWPKPRWRRRERAGGSTGPRSRPPPPTARPRW